ncbi:MAG: hypothetical protein WCK17_07985 [Verrucomicrobiota bacterium]
MPPLEPFLIFTRKLNALDLTYMVTGSVAAIYYGEPRMTNDVDIVVFPRPEDALRLEPAFPQTEFYCPPRETIQIEQRPRQVSVPSAPLQRALNAGDRHFGNHPFASDTSHCDHSFLRDSRRTDAQAS